jgi:hypothetical protein
LALLELAAQIAARGEIAEPPQTLLGLALPWLGGALSTPIEAVAGTALIAIPALVIAGISARRSVRTLLIVALLALLGGLVAAAGRAGPANALIAGVIAAAALAAAAAAIRWWGALCALSWVIAQLIDRAIKALHEAWRAPTMSEQAAGFVSLAVALALVFALVRYAEAGSPRAAAGPEGTLTG